MGDDIDIRKARKYLLALPLLIIGLVGCSAFGKTDMLKPNLDETPWKTYTSKGFLHAHACGFQQGSFTVYICPVVVKRTILSAGPPLIPLIPAPDIKDPRDPPRNVDLYIGIECPSSEVTIDISEVAMILPDRRKLGPIQVRTWGGVFPYACHRQADRKTVIQQYVINKDTRYFSMEFDIPYTEVKECVIELGTLVADGNHIKLPSLKLKKGSTYQYAPFFLPLPR